MTGRGTQPDESSASAAAARAARELKAAGIERARAEADLLVCEAAGQSPEWLLVHPEAPLSPQQVSRLDEMVGRRARREPLPYVLGRVEFCSLDFLTGPAAIVPRPETEILVEAALARAERARFAVDVGTGCGALAVVLARERPGLTVLGIDISREALHLAKRNIARHGLEGRVQLAAGDLLGPVGRKADLVVANLPYIRTGEFPSLSPEVREWEPRIALDGGDDGLALIRRLAGQLGRHLSAGGIAALEVGAGQAGEVANLLRRAGLTEVEVIADYAKIDRVVIGRHRG